MATCKQLNTNIYNKIGKNIKKYRKLRNYTQKELSEKSNVSENLIAKLESVTFQTISIDTLEIIANILNVDIGKFFD